MKMNGLLLGVGCAIGLCISARGALAAGAEDPAHEELRVLRTNVIEAIIKGDVEAQLRYVHTNVVVTWQNGEVARGQEGLRQFFARTGKATFKGYKVPPRPDELTILHGGDTGIIFGDSVAEYELFGRGFEFQNRWTATLVKEDGRWLLAGYHVSLNALDNPIVNAAKRSLFVAGGITGAIGLVLGVMIGRGTKKPKPGNA